MHGRERKVNKDGFWYRLAIIIVYSLVHEDGFEKDEKIIISHFDRIIRQFTLIDVTQVFQNNKETHTHTHVHPQTNI